MVLLLLGLTIPMVTTVAAESAHPLQDHEEIRATAAAFVRTRYADSNRGDELKIRPGALDPRLRLKSCEQPLEAFTTGTRAIRSNASIGVQCPGHWKLYVPVRIEKPARVLVIQNPQTRGAVINEADLDWIVADTLRLSQGYFTRPEQVVGHRLRQSVPAGAVLTHSLIDEQPLIERGERVMLTLSNSSIGVRAPAEALESARQGERIRVRNLSSGRTIEGIATGPKRVEVQ